MKIPKNLAPGDHLWYSETEYATVIQETSDWPGTVYTTVSKPFFKFMRYYLRDGKEVGFDTPPITRIERIASKAQPAQDARPDRMVVVPPPTLIVGDGGTTYDNRTAARPDADEAAPNLDYAGEKVRQYIAAMRAKLAEAEKRADEMEGKAGEWKAADVHRERLATAVSAISVVAKKREAERDRLAARVKDLEADAHQTGGIEGRLALDLSAARIERNEARAELAAERERRICHEAALQSAAEQAEGALVGRLAEALRDSSERLEHTLSRLGCADNGDGHGRNADVDAMGGHQALNGYRALLAEAEGMDK